MTTLDHVLSTLRRLARDADLGLVPLAKLRRELSAIDRATLDTELLRLRHAGVVQLVTHDGRHGRLSPEDLAAEIVEQDRRFIYAKLVGEVGR